MPPNARSEGLTLDEGVSTARLFVEEAAKREITMRVLGGLGISIRSIAANRTYEHFLKDRIKGFDKPFPDLDFVSLSKQRDGVAKLIQEFGYEPRGRFTAVEFDRMIFRHPIKNFVIDVFLDRLTMCHTIDFRNRLSLDDLTLTPADLLLSKMQIVEINEKDVKDTVTLLLDHQVGDNDEKGIDCRYIAELFANDWGFYYTFTRNLRKIKNDFQFVYQDVIPGNLIRDLYDKIDRILQAIENEPKSLGWKMRAKVGPRKKWYQEVDTT
jgi:hypothetical protein